MTEGSITIDGQEMYQVVVEKVGFDPTLLLEGAAIYAGPDEIHSIKDNEENGTITMIFNNVQTGLCVADYVYNYV